MIVCDKDSIEYGVWRTAYGVGKIIGWSDFTFASTIQTPYERWMVLTNSKRIHYFSVAYCIKSGTWYLVYSLDSCIIIMYICSYTTNGPQPFGTLNDFASASAMCKLLKSCGEKVRQKRFRLVIGMSMIHFPNILTFHNVACCALVI